MPAKPFVLPRCGALLLCASVAGIATAHELAQNAGGAPAPAAPAVPLVPESELPADPRFQAARIQADVTFLADDLLEGRDTGSPGHEIAARYVATQFAAFGLKPLGDKGSYFQRITFQKTEKTDAPAGVAISGPAGSATFDYGVDALVSVNANEPTLDVSAPLVFVGYGIENARMKLNDYAGLDVKGKIVVMLRGFPAGLPSEEAAHLSATKAEVAQAHGAIGIISIDTPVSAKTASWPTRLRRATGSSFTWVAPDGKAFDEAAGIRAAAGLSDKGAEALFAGAPMTVAQVRALTEKPGGAVKGFALKTSARIFGASRSSRITSPNVIAMLPGSDPTLKDQYVVLSGHLDHIGINAARPGDAADADRINNGALDNAAGTATTLEVARVLAQDKVAPRRSVIFLLSTAEEKGLLGADYFARHPTVPIEKIVGNVDLDMPLLLYPFNGVVAFGADHSTIGRLVGAAVAPMKVGLERDPMPEETVFVRSDHYGFVKQGVPALYLSVGFGNGGAAHWSDFLANRYHSPGDDMAQAINWQAGARFAEANYRVTRAMADSDMPPLWYQGDFFGDLFAPNAAKVKK